MALLIALGVIVLLFLLISWIQERARRRREAQIRAWAESRDMAYAAEAGPALDTGASLLFIQGTGGKPGLFMHGQRDGIDVALFEYRFWVPAGRYYRNWVQTVVRLASPDLALPAFAIIPAPVFDAMTERARTKEMREQLETSPYLTFREAPEFSRRNHVYAPDKERVRALITPEVIAFYESHPGLCTEGYEDALFFYRLDQLVDPDALDDVLSEALEAYQLFKTDRRDV